MYFYLQNLSPGGAQPVVLRLANEFKRRGRVVVIIVNNLKNPFWRALADPAIEIVDLGVGNWLAASVAIARFVRRRRPAVIVSAMTHANLAAVAGARLSFVKTRVIIAEHHACSEWMKGLRWSRRLVYGLVLPPVYRQADGHIAVSQVAADDLASVLGIPARQIATIYNAAPDQQAVGELTAPVHRWFAGGQDRVIVAVGRLEVQKNFELLIRAFAMLRARLPAKLLILGEGSERQTLQALIGALGLDSDIELAGQVNMAIRYIKFADLFVMSSRFEGFPIVLIEALACGTPVVSTDCRSGPREILLDGALGPLTPVGDAEALAAAMEHTLRNPGPAAARIRRAAQFTIGEQADQYQRVVDTCGKQGLPS